MHSCTVLTKAGMRTKPHLHYSSVKQAQNYHHIAFFLVGKDHYEIFSRCGRQRQQLNLLIEQWKL